MVNGFPPLSGITKLFEMKSHVFSIIINQKIVMLASPGVFGSVLGFQYCTFDGGWMFPHL